jgi:hypothetical protein
MVGIRRRADQEEAARASERLGHEEDLKSAEPPKFLRRCLAFSPALPPYVALVS